MVGKSFFDIVSKDDAAKLKDQMSTAHSADASDELQGSGSSSAWGLYNN